MYKRPNEFALRHGWIASRRRARYLILTLGAQISYRGLLKFREGSKLTEGKADRVH